ncbi:MAG: redox-sensing transcriptional repressor Rex [Clostridia bacterium]|nr:redox-sensing transcriptional repressor Rex [Clostridia bacterium]
MDKPSVPKATLGRLPQYLQYLKDLPEDRYPYISATAIAKALSLGEVRVRKDLGIISGAGKPKLGYVTVDLINDLEEYLGCNRSTSAVLVGAGKLGRALLEYEEFEKFGVRIAAAFDCNEQVIRLGRRIEILPMNQFDSFCRAQHIGLGIITVGEGSAQAVCNQMVQSGITAIWNFAPCKLTVPKGVLIKNENLALSLAYLNYQLCNFN